MRVQRQMNPAPVPHRNDPPGAAKSARPMFGTAEKPARRKQRSDGREDHDRGGDLPALPPPMGGPLALHAAPPKVDPVGPAAAALCDRIIVGKTRDGIPEVRLDLGIGQLRGTEVRLTAGLRGLEATFVTATEAARRVVEAQLADLARALEGKGIHVARCQVTSREREQRAPRDGRSGRSDPRPDDLPAGVSG